MTLGRALIVAFLVAVALVIVHELTRPAIEVYIEMPDVVHAGDTVTATIHVNQYRLIGGEPNATYTLYVWATCDIPHHFDYVIRQERYVLTGDAEVEFTVKVPDENCYGIRINVDEDGYTMLPRWHNSAFMD